MKLTRNIFLALMLATLLQGCFSDVEEIANEVKLLQENEELTQKVTELEQQLNQKRSNLNKMFN